MQKVAVVTGANRGMGLEASRQLSKLGVQVILTSRDNEKGFEALKSLEKEGLKIAHHQLDVTSPDSINSLTTFIEKEYGRLDILVNNAGILLEPHTPEASVLSFSLEKIKQTIETNTFGPLMISRSLVPLMKKNSYGRIVNVSSGMGQLQDMNGSYPGYRFSKVALNALTRMLADELKDSGILVNSVCPGWVRTDMGGSQAERPIEKGVETTVWLATLPDSGPTGKFFRDKKEIPW